MHIIAKPSCPTCGSEIREIVLCLQCHMAHGLNLFRSRHHEKISCMDLWHDEGGCLNADCDHPNCPVHSEVNLWEGERVNGEVSQ
jgi:hypothetical protein